MTKIQSPRGMTLGIEEKYEEVRQLISIGRQRGYLVYDEVNDILPEEISTSVEEIEELYDRLGEHGIELVDSEEQWKERVAANEAKKALTAKEEGTKLDLTPGTLEKTNDPVRMYLREMGTVPLLTREGEVAIARRIERGEKRVLKAFSRNRWVITEILAAPERIKKERRALEEMFMVTEEESEQPIEKKLGVIKGSITRIGRLSREVPAGTASLRAAPSLQFCGTNRTWPDTHCPRCDAPSATSFEFYSYRRMWYACLACDAVWLGARQE